MGLDYYAPATGTLAAPIVYLGTAGATDDGAGLAAQLAVARTAKTKLIVRGSLTFQSAVVLASNDWIEFENATCTLGYNGNFFQASTKNTIRFTGTVTFVGARGTFAGNGIQLTACTNVEIDWDCNASGFALTPKYLILGLPSGATPGQGFVLKGQTTTTDSAVIRLVDYSQVDISGVQTVNGGMTSDCVDDVVRCLSDGAAGTIRQINIHDCQFDGGGILTKAPISVAANSGQPDIIGVTIHAILVRNTQTVPSTTLTDGIDVNRCSDVIIADITGDTVNSLVAAVASRMSISNVQAENCNAGGVAVGDGSTQTENISDVAVPNCVSINCGQHFTTGNGAGFVVAATSTFTVDRVTFTGCRSRDTTGSAQKYGLGFVNNGTITNIEWTGGYLHGFTQAILNSINAQLDLRGTQLFNGATRIHGLVIALPFDDTTGHTVGILQTADTPTAAPVLTNVYVVGPTRVHFEITESATGTVTWKDSAGTTKEAFIATEDISFTAEPGDTLTFATAQPTSMTVSQAG